MKEKFTALVVELFQDHPLPFITTSAAFVLALVILIIGFWATLFVVVLTISGFVWGRWLEADEQRFEEFVERVSRIFKRR